MATKQIPYGLTDFERIRTANYYYVDKTRYIAEVERNASFFFLIRPRLLMITVPLVSGSLPTTTNVSSIRASGRKWRVCQMLTRS